jgi:hypothetical protein
MLKKAMPGRLMGAAMLIASLAILAFASSASAHTGEYAKFNYCPSTNSAVFKCLHAETTGGKIVLGKKTVPIVHPVVLQGGTDEAQPPGYTSKFYGATNGETLTKAAQPVPGGLTGLINCKEISVSWVRTSCEAVFENGVTGVNATLELAGSPSAITTSEVHLLNEVETALHIPLKVHLENPFLGSSCYVGSTSSPIIWNLTTGATAPPAPNKSIHGAAGELEFREEFEIIHLTNASLVDNSWSAPKASGCGGFLIEYLLDPIINASVGLPAAAGTNTAILTNQIDIALAGSVNEH